MSDKRHMIVIVDGASAPEVAHVVSEHYLGYGVDASEISGVDVRELVEEGWWHPNTNAGKVHGHPERPNGNWSVTNHRLCEPLYRALRGREERVEEMGRPAPVDPHREERATHIDLMDAHPRSSGVDTSDPRDHGIIRRLP